MPTPNRWLIRINVVAALLAFCVILLGAYTRLTDAGLGCPDWPGCYNHITVPESQHAIAQAEQAFPGQPIQATKAWTEMIHRYAAGTLGLLIAFSCFLALQRRLTNPHMPVVIPLMTVGVVIFQALLGMWTVTEKLLPLVVMGHLLGGMAILSLLTVTILQLKTPRSSKSQQTRRSFRLAICLGLVCLILQILIGGWTSTNYAALACPSFPFCFRDHAMIWNFHAAFNWLTPVGHMSQSGLMTIQMIHRLWGMVTFTYLLVLSTLLFRHSQTTTTKRLSIAVLILVSTQFLLGLINVLWLLPLSTAVMHNGIAAILLITLIITTHRLFHNPQEY